MGVVRAGRARRRAAYRTPPIARPTTKAPPRTRLTTPTFILGKTVVVTRINDITSSTPMIKVATALSHGRLTQGPSTSRSLHSRRRNTDADGSKTPARA